MWLISQLSVFNSRGPRAHTVLKEPRECNDHRQIVRNQNSNSSSSSSSSSSRRRGVRSGIRGEGDRKEASSARTEAPSRRQDSDEPLRVNVSVRPSDDNYLVKCTHDNSLIITIQTALVGLSCMCVCMCVKLAEVPTYICRLCM